MAVEPLASEGNYFHIYDFTIKPNINPKTFIAKFNEFDYSPDNPMHKSKAQVKDGVLVQDVTNPLHFWLIAEWRDIEEHARIRKVLAEVLKPEFVSMIQGTGFIPDYGKIVSATPHHVLNP